MLTHWSLISEINYCIQSRAGTFSTVCNNWLSGRLRQLQFIVNFIDHQLHMWCYIYISCSPSCCSKSITLLFIFKTQMKIFLTKPERFVFSLKDSCNQHFWCFKMIHTDILKTIHINPVVWSMSSEEAQSLYILKRYNWGIY